jgi:hypothetical protein
MLASAAAYMNSDFVSEPGQPALHGTDHASRDAARMPIHAHHTAPNDCKQKGLASVWPRRSNRSHLAYRAINGRRHSYCRAIDPAPVEIDTFAKRAADIISRAAVKARERLGRKAQR